eukprot:CAMPEP_0170591466 /NCGR_PEP_ID=MMETSP0224-20130122/12420_1 /TAXON_ID=285029 /ORGANISM="Togula jolla, Strain CCCM 725" /LENGTH=170 /DNA_ID=CAMNT_0010915335 /DNA_START=78 /DNA_END=590 /DNA_ORIENTATION=+
MYRALWFGVFFATLGASAAEVNASNSSHDAPARRLVSSDKGFLHQTPEKKVRYQHWVSALQHRTSGGSPSCARHLAVPDHIGMQAPLTRVGYLQVATACSDEEMKAFIYRVLLGHGRQIKAGEEDTLNGFVPFFSGTAAVQDFDQLQEELKVAEWTEPAAQLQMFLERAK